MTSLPSLPSIFKFFRTKAYTYYIPNITRKLVSIRQISALRDIAGTPDIQIAVIDGWTCLVRARQFIKDELVVFFEIDAFLPPPTEDSRYGWTYNPAHHSVITWKGYKGIHVKSIMINNCFEISQGVVLKLKEFPEVEQVYEYLTKKLGDNKGEEQAMSMCFAGKLGVKKWERNEAGICTPLGRLPTFFPTTDIERVQNIQTIFTLEHSKAVYQESVKVDGSPMTVYYVKKDSQYYRSLPHLPVGSKGDMENGRFGVCSRNSDLAEGGKSIFWEVALRN